jgi:Na+-translocating ferredoxin:NAD+ oxidoreductase RnfG subunit
MHSKNNIIKAATLIVAALIFFSFTFPDWEYDKGYNTIVHKSIAEIFNSSSLLVEDLIDAEESLYVIKQKDVVLGYCVVAQAPSKFHQFDYYIIFNSEAEILKIEILQYRENYGAEICSKNWLANFIKISTNTYPEYNRRIDGISGATISVNSIKRDVFKVSNMLKKLILDY